VVSPEFHPDMPDAVERIADAYRAAHLDGAALVFAATDLPQVNDAVVRDAHDRGALVCRADGDDDTAGDFSTPAMLRQGDVLVTVSSGGSPAFSAMIRDRLQAAFDPRWGEMAAAMRVLRPRIRSALTPPRRRDALRALCSDEAMQEFSRGGVDGLADWLKQRFSEL
jgi:precorrin-2 dehydrogenase/sirohydrochlorin ferrochelatase